MRDYFLMIIIYIILMLIVPRLVLANDESLYAAPPPNDASFVRFIGFDIEETVSFAGKSFTIKHDDIEVFIPVSSGQLDGVLIGSYHSVLKIADGSIIVVGEASRSDPTKVALTLLNADSQPLTLGVADGSMDVISNVKTASSGQRSVNPIAIALGIFNELNKNLVARFDVALRRGQNITFLSDANGVRIIEDRYGANAE